MLSPRLPGPAFPQGSAGLAHELHFLEHELIAHQQRGVALDLLQTLLHDRHARPSHRQPAEGGRCGLLRVGLHVGHGLFTQLVEAVHRVGGAILRGRVRWRHVRRLIAPGPAGTGLLLGGLLAFLSDPLLLLLGRLVRLAGCLALLVRACALAGFFFLPALALLLLGLRLFAFALLGAILLLSAAAVFLRSLFLAAGGILRFLLVTLVALFLLRLVLRAGFRFRLFLALLAASLLLRLLFLTAGLFVLRLFFTRRLGLLLLLFLAGLGLLLLVLTLPRRIRRLLLILLPLLLLAGLRLGLARLVLFRGLPALLLGVFLLRAFSRLAFLARLTLR